MSLKSNDNETSVQYSKDEQLLASLGYKQELKSKKSESWKCWRLAASGIRNVAVLASSHHQMPAHLLIDAPLFPLVHPVAPA